MLNNFRPKKWNENLERPHLDYSDIFEEEVGQIPGQFLIQNFFFGLVIVENKLLVILNACFDKFTIS